MVARYMVTGWCSKRGNWNEDYVVAKNKQIAVELFKFLNPTLRKIKAHRLHKENSNGI